MSSPSGEEVRTEDIPVIPNPNAPSVAELQAIWRDATRDIPSQPQARVVPSSAIPPEFADESLCNN